MPRSMVAGLLVAVGTAMSAMVGLIHGVLVWLILLPAAVCAGQAAALALPSKKKTLRCNFLQICGINAKCKMHYNLPR